MFLASQEIYKQFQHFDSGQKEPKSDTFFQRNSNTLNSSYDYSTSENSNDSSKKNNNEQSQSDDIDEARYNLATRIMSNGVEVIIASDKTKTPDYLVPDISNSQLQYNKPMTLAASTIKNQMMILLFPSSAPSIATDNNFVANPSSQQLNYDLPFHTSHFITKTCLTTYTYRTTYVQEGRTTVESREKVISNIATEERNYPKITPTETIGVTLTKTPELAVGIFPTTYSYFNTFKDNSYKLHVMTSEYTVVNTITGPNDYVAYLQPTAKATPALKTNTYYNEVTLSQKIKSKMHTIKRNLTQVVVTKSYTPAYSTSVLTSYYAYDGDSLKDSKDILNLLKTSLALNKGEKEKEILNEYKTKVLDDIHIYATKTFLTTFTYYTTTVLNSYLSDTSQTELDIKPMSTVFNYYTRIIENVLTDSVPTTLLQNELLTKIKIELSKQKPNQRRRLIVTTATLKNGQTLKISAMEMYKGNLASDSFKQSSSSFIATPQSQPAEESLSHTPEEIENLYNNQDEANEDFQLQGTLNFSDHLPFLKNVKQPENEGSQEDNNGFASLPSEQILTVVQPPIKQPSNANTPVGINDKPSTSAANKLIQRLTALKPMFSAVAGLLQNNFGVTRDTIKPITNIESKQSLIKKNNSSATNSLIDTKHPIYIPVQKSPTKNNPYEFSNYTEFIPQSLHINPPSLVNKEENNFELNGKESTFKDKHTNIIPLSTFTQEQPLHNGGIYIRPGEVITANSDVIVGKPNGIEYVKIPNQVFINKNISNAFPLDNRQFQVTYYHNKVQHPYKKKTSSASFTSITHKPQHIPVVNNGKTNNKLNPQLTIGLRPPNEHFNKNILRPPPPPAPSIIQTSIPVHSQQGLSLMLTAPDKPARNRGKQPTSANTHLSAESTSPFDLHSPPLLAAPTHKISEFSPSQAPPSISKPNFYNFNNDLKNNEVLEIQQNKPALGADFKPSSVQNPNSSRKPQAQYHMSTGHVTTVTEADFDKNPNSLNWQNTREPLTLTSYMRLQPETNIVQPETDQVSSEYSSKHATSSNWINIRKTQNKTSASPSYINVENKSNFGVLNTNSMSEVALTGSSSNYQLYSHVNNENTISFQNYQNPVLSSNQQKRRPTAVSSANVADMKVFLKTLHSTPSTKPPFYYSSSNSLLNNEKFRNYFNESVTKNHQNVSLDQHIFSHTVDVNVPPLTFNREDHDYPQQAATAVRGQIPSATVKDLHAQAKNVYKYMPLITIPANEQQVQVSLTPLNSISALTLPLEVSNKPSWKTVTAINDDNNNHTVRKISLHNNNFNFFTNDQDQKTFATNNILNFKPKPEVNSNWKHHKRQQLPELDTTKTVNNAVRPTEGKKSKTEQHFRSTLKPKRKDQQTKLSGDSHISSRKTIQPLVHIQTDLEYSPQTLVNELKSVFAQPSHIEPNDSDCLVSEDHNGEKEKTRTQQILTIKETSKEQNRANRVPIKKPDSITTSSKTSKITTATTRTSEPTPEDINEIMNFNKKANEANEAMQATQIVIHGEPFKKRTQNNREQNKESFARSNNQTKTTGLFIAPGETFKTATSIHDANVKITTIKPELPPIKENLTTEQSLLDIFISRETQHSTQYNKKIFNRTPTIISNPLNTAITETVFGLHPPPLITSTHSNITTKKSLPKYSLSISEEKTYEGTRKRQPNKANEVMQNYINSEVSPKKINYTSTTSAYKIKFGEQSQVKQTDESFERQSMVAINTVYNNENTTLESNPSLANIGVTKHYENESRLSNESFKLSNLQPSESYEGKISLTMTSPLVTSTLTFTTTIKRIILPTKYITNKRVYTVTTTATAPKLRPISSTNFLSTTETTTEVTTLFLTHTKINTIIDTVTSVKTLEPITITATTTVKPLATESRVMELSLIKHSLSDSTNNDSFSSTEQNALEKNQDLTYLPYPSVEVVSTNISQESTLNPNENSIFIIMTNNKNKNNTVFTLHHSTSQIDPIRQNLEDDNNIGQIDQTNEVMIEYDNGISFDDISIREEEPLQIVNGKSVASSAFVNNEATATESSTDDHIFLGGVLIATSPKLPTEHLSSNRSTNASCQPKCRASRNEQCVLNDNNWSCLCRSGFARMFPDRSCKPMYTYDLLVHVERIGNYPLHVNELKNNKTEHYKQLSQLVNNALDRMIMQSDFRDAYHGVQVTDYMAGGGRDYHGILFNVLLQLSDNSNENRLEEVFKKNLRLSNYSIGETDLYTNKAGVDALIVKDFNECTTRKLHDCSENAHCFNLPGTYTCSCMVGFADLSENPIYPGRICSSEQIGCELCHYHGKCLTLVANSNDRNYCECFPWYAGSRCQVNLKILLILLLGIGTLLFILLLFCILITCTKRRHHHLQHAALAPSTMTTSSEGLQKNPRLSANMVITSVGLRNSFHGVSLKNNKRPKSTKLEKRLMIKDSSSETSQNSLPYVLKNRESISSSCNKKKMCLLKHSKKYRNCSSQGTTIEQYSLSVPSNMHKENQSDLNTVIATSSSFKENGQQTEQQILLENVTDYEGHYCEQSDRSLTVMIPRAKYHSSVLSQKQLMHHQLTMERVHKTSKSENNDKDPEVRRNHKKNLPSTREIADEEKRAEIPSNPGALISAGFEVSAIVKDNTRVKDSREQKHNDLVNFDSIPPNYTINTTSDLATSVDSNACQTHLLNEERQQYAANKKFSISTSDYNVYKCEKDLIETMDEWLGNVKLNELSAEARSFDETTIRASTKPLRISVYGTHTQLHDEVNTMAERDIGSTFLLPHTHLYKPERQESELSGFDSF